jgi:hypothetical protein
LRREGRHKRDSSSIENTSPADESNGESDTPPR